MSEADTVIQDAGVAVEVALGMLQLAAKLWPELGQWLGGLVSGQTDPISLRVADVLPVKSASRQAQEDLGG